ncbi:MAG: histidine phosphatase family protein [Rhodocyclaceae bacterium]
MARTLFLIRHGAPEVAAGICYGSTDIGLREAAADTATRLRAALPMQFDLFSSPLQRCRLLAEALGSPICDARLAEMHFGAWEGLAFDAIPRGDIDAWATTPLDFRPPGGETAREMAVRAQAALGDVLARSTGDIVLVTHGGPLRAMVARLTGEAPDAATASAGPWLARSFRHGSLSMARLHTDGHATLRMDVMAASAGRTR